jgi:FtsZ-binding cell division protein ZapB
MRRPLGEVPDDVRKRYKILNETNLARRHSIAVGGGGGGSVPQRKRRLSSRELMKQEQSSGIELVIRNGDNDARLFDNPMKKSGQTSVASGDVALKMEIVALKKDNIGLKQDNIGLKQDNIGLKREMKQMKERVKAMDNKIAMILAGSMPNSKTLAKTTAKTKAKPKTKNKKWKSAKNKLKSVTAFKQRRRSSLMTSSAEVDFVNTVHVDDETGREYSIDPTTGIAEWLVREGEEEEVHVDPDTGRKYNSKGWL